MTYHKPSRSMWANAVELLEQANQLHRQFFQLGKGPAGGPTWEPPIDVFETDQHLSVLVALPGVTSEHLSVIIDSGVLIVIGQRPMPAPAVAHIRRIEIPYGRFERHIELPQGQFEIQESKLAHGCLLLSLRKLA